MSERPDPEIRRQVEAFRAGSGELPEALVEIGAVLAAIYDRERVTEAEADEIIARTEGTRFRSGREALEELARLGLAERSAQGPWVKTQAA